MMALQVTSQWSIALGAFAVGGGVLVLMLLYNTVVWGRKAFRRDDSDPPR